jgi:hypothetical protein
VKVLPKHLKVSAVITSPPYPNRFSYARETRPHLFFFDFIRSAKAVGQLETDAIGGTWGKATSVLANGITPKNKLIQSLLDPYVFEHFGFELERIDRMRKRQSKTGLYEAVLFMRRN